MSAKVSGGLRCHVLKCWPQFFEAICVGTKRHEIRKNDRDYRVGDELVLREWDPKTESYTGRSLSLDVTYISSGSAPGVSFGLPTDLVVMSVKRNRRVE